MSPATPFSDIAGIRGYSVGDIGGNTVESHPSNHGTDEVVVIVAMIANTFGTIGTLLGVGKTSTVTVRGDHGSWVVAYRDGYSIAVDLDANVPTANVESAIQRGEWVPKAEWEITDSEVQYVPPSTDQASVVSAPPTKPINDPPAAELPRMPKPPSPRRNTESAAPTQPSIAPSLASANARGLRRALIRGDLKAAQAIAEHLKDASPSKVDPCGSGVSAKAIGPLISGIASVLSGDNAAALQQFALISEQTEFGPSLNWIALVWSTKANVASAEGLDKALVCVETAGRLSKQLDIEARVVTARLVAEVCLHRNDLQHAERFVEQARRLSESLADRDASAELSLLQAQIFLAAGKQDQAILSAERAHVYRQYWVAPVSFLCRCALGKADVNRAQRLIAPLYSDAETPAGVLCIARLLEAVQQSVLGPEIAAEFLELEATSASSSCIARLEELSESFPRVEAFSDTLGWKLLKAGLRDRAAAVFERLGERRDLPDDIRSSVLLALGYLAANKHHHGSAGAKVRAMVEAAPRHLQSAKPAAESHGRMRSASPVEMADLNPPPASRGRTSHGGNCESTVAIGSSPVFRGNLNHFCFPDVLEFLRAGRRTGTLVCSSVRGIGAVHLREGSITGAAAPTTPSLKDMLIESGKLTTMLAEQAASVQRAATAAVPLEGILVKEGWSTANDISACLRAQVRSAVTELMHWGDGQFAFELNAVEFPLAGQSAIALDPRLVLWNIQNGLDEPARESP